jgi:hypothetical protein
MGMETSVDAEKHAEEGQTVFDLDQILSAQTRIFPEPAPYNRANLMQIKRAGVGPAMKVQFAAGDSCQC